MHKLTQYRLCPHSRAVRLVMAEIGMDVELVEQLPWDFRPGFLALNPAGELPVLEVSDGLTLCGAYSISEYFGDLLRDFVKDGHPAPLFPGSSEDRAEVRRLTDWFCGKFHREVTREMLQERVYGFLNVEAGHTPDASVLRAARANLRYHLSYLNYLGDQRRWLAGDEMSFADLAAAAQLSTLDYLGEIGWDEYSAARLWYTRIKSRPAFRALLADRIAGVQPSKTYSDLDF